jgi:hypothetical protein
VAGRYSVTAMGYTRYKAIFRKAERIMRAGIRLVVILGLAAVTSRADSLPTLARSDVSRLPRAIAELYRETKLFPREPRWQRIPWLLDLNEGIRLAKEEKRPLLIWTSGDDPLERC